MSKGKKRQRHNGGSDPFVLDGEEFPQSITVELWHRPAKGKRELVDTRRYELVAPAADPTAPEVPAKSSAAPASPRVRARATSTPRATRTRIRKPATSD